MLVRPILFAFIVLIALGRLHAQEDGVYEWTPGDGPAIRLKVISGQIRSLSNSNDLFTADVCFDPDGRPNGTLYYFMLDGTKKARSSHGTNGNNATFTLDNLTKAEAASASTLFGLPLKLRQHPGHRIDAVFTTDKPAYAPGEPVTVTMILKNLGDEPVYLTRDNCGPKVGTLSFAPMSIPYGNAEVKNRFGVLICSTSIEMLPAGGEIRISANLNEWIETKVPGQYYLLGSYLLEMFKRPRDESALWESAVWIDYATRGFHFAIQ